MTRLRTLTSATSKIPQGREDAPEDIAPHIFESSLPVPTLDSSDLQTDTSSLVQPTGEGLEKEDPSKNVQKKPLSRRKMKRNARSALWRQKKLKEMGLDPRIKLNVLKKLASGVFKQTEDTPEFYKDALARDGPWQPNWQRSVSKSCKST